MKKDHLGPQLSVWFMQVSLFSSVHINRFHCITYTNTVHTIIVVGCKFYGQLNFRIVLFVITTCASHAL